MKTTVTSSSHLLTFVFWKINVFSRQCGAGRGQPSCVDLPTGEHQGGEDLKLWFYEICEGLVWCESMRRLDCVNLCCLQLYLEGRQTNTLLNQGYETSKWWVPAFIAELGWQAVLGLGRPREGIWKELELSSWWVGTWETLLTFPCHCFWWSWFFKVI